MRDGLFKLDSESVACRNSSISLQLGKKHHLVFHLHLVPSKYNKDNEIRGEWSQLTLHDCKL